VNLFGQREFNAILLSRSSCDFENCKDCIPGFYHRASPNDICVLVPSMAASKIFLASAKPCLSAKNLAAG
jgi:hypothetical protein